MRFEETPLAGAYRVWPEPMADERGFFARTACTDEFAAHGLVGAFAQSSVSFNARRGTVRGMHFSVPAETKLVRCTGGAIHDVIVDLRSDSASYLKSFAAVLTARDRCALYIPAGFAHGFQALTDDAEVLYMIDHAYVAGSARGLRWNDPALDVSWPEPVTVIAARDLAYPDLAVPGLDGVRVLVTGASGFVGRHAVPALTARGFEVHAVGRVSISGAVVHAADLLDEPQRRALMAEVAPSHLLHLAWDAEPGRYWTSPRNLDWVAASLDLARRFREAGGRRLVVSGTCAEYAWGPSRFDEATSACRPATLYGAAKDGTRRILSAYAESAGLSFAWGRLFYLYGPGERRGRLVSDAAHALLTGAAFPTSPGHQARDFLHVVDAAEALAALLDGPVTGAVNIASGTAVPVRTLLDGIADRTGRPDLLDYGARALGPSEPPVIEAAVARLAEEVGFRPRFTLETGLDDTLAWWRAALAGGSGGQ